MTPVRFCPNCGQPNEMGARFCGHCGHQLNQPSSALSEDRRRGLIAVLVYALVVIIALAVAGYFLRPHFLQPMSVAGGRFEDREGEPTDVAELHETEAPTQTATPVEVTAPTVAASPTALPPTQKPDPSETPTPTLTATPVPTNTPTPVPSPTPSPTIDPGPETLVIGRSVNDIPIEVVRFGNGRQSIIFVGGLHAGFAPGTVSLARRAIEYFTRNPDTIPGNLTVYVIPSANPDSPVASGELRGRLNANDVDLNRNWDCDWAQDAHWRGNIVRSSGGPAPFSEPETQSLRDFILEKQARAVIFWEARAEGGLASPGNCGARSQTSETLATTYGRAAQYNIADFETLTDQVLNGDSTNWLDQQGIPAIAVLLPQYTSIDWENNLAGIQAALQLYGE